MKTLSKNSATIDTGVTLISYPAWIAAAIWVMFHVGQNPTFFNDLGVVGFTVATFILPVYAYLFAACKHVDVFPIMAALLFWDKQDRFGHFVFTQLHCSSFFVFGAYIGLAWNIGTAGDGLLMSAAALVSLMAVYFFSFQSLINSPESGSQGLPSYLPKSNQTLQPECVPCQGAGAATQAAPAAHQSSSSGDRYDFDFRQPKIKLDDLAGMRELKAQLRDIIRPFQNYASVKGGVAIADRNGILLSGPAGNGKTTFAEAIAGELGLRFVKVTVGDLTSQFVNETPKVLKSLQNQTVTTPTLLFFDEVDSVATSRGADTHSEDKKTVNALLTMIDELRQHRVLLVAATNFPDKLDPAFSRQGRFDFSVEIPYPDLEARESLLQGLLKKHGIRAEAALVHKVAELWERRSVAFLEGTVKRLRDNGLTGAQRPSIDDFKQAARETSHRPSAIPKEGPKVSELALAKNVREESESLLYRLRNWESIAEKGGEVPTGVLLYGPPGTGKTAFVRAIARELEHWHVFEVNTTEVLHNPNKFREIVQLAADHRPAFVFLDEADELLRERNGSHAAGATNEILKCMDGMMGKVPEVVFIAATNNPQALDAAAIRGGRFAEKIHMPRLEGADLIAFLAKELRERAQVHFHEDITAETLAQRFGSVAPADALAVLRKAVTYTFGNAQPRPVGFPEVEKAMDSLGL